MKKFLILLLLCGSAFADGVYHDPARPGEGIVVLERDTQVVFYFFSYADPKGSGAPTVSPPPPPPEVQQKKNSQAWYFGLSDDFDGEVGTGKVYVTKAANGYPARLRRDGSTGSVVEVGTFVIERSGDGYSLDILESPFSLEDGHVLYIRQWDFSEAVFQ